MKWLICTMLLIACSGRSTVHTSNIGVVSDDERLIERVRDAARAGVTSGNLEAAIGASPTFSTARGQPIEILARAELVADPDHPAERFVYDETAGVVYWTRPITSHNPRVVGIAFLRDGSTRMFFAEILPP